TNFVKYFSESIHISTECSLHLFAKIRSCKVARLDVGDKFLLVYTNERQIFFWHFAIFRWFHFKQVCVFCQRGSWFRWSLRVRILTGRFLECRFLTSRKLLVWHCCWLLLCRSSWRFFYSTED